jgi:Arc/MetJ-type ribon-helix-helix transcriptional regulator
MTQATKKGNEEEKREKEETASNQEKNVFEEFGDSVGKFATKTVESIKKTIDKALVSRNTVLTIRVNDDANEKLGMLVETGLFKSRSESAAYLIEEGIKHQTPLFEKVEKKFNEIGKLKGEIKDILSGEMKKSEKK